MRVARLPRDKADEPPTASLGEVEPEMIRERPMTVRSLGRLKELGDLGDVMRRQLSLDVETTHLSRLLANRCRPVDRNCWLVVAISPRPAR